MNDSGWDPERCEDFAHSIFGVPGDWGTAWIILFTVTCVITVASTVLFLESFVYIYRNIQSNVRKARLTWQLCIYPAVITLSFIGYNLPENTLILQLCSSIFISLSHYQFLLLISDYYESSQYMEPGMRNAVCCCMSTVEASPVYRKCIRGCIITVCFVVPIVLFVSTVTWITDTYNGFLKEVPVSSVLTAVYLVALLAALVSIYGLTLFVCQATRMAIAEYRVNEKFAVTALVMFLFNLQNFIFGLISTLVIIKCDLTAENSYHLEFSLAASPLSRVEAESRTVTEFFARFGHLVLLAEMFCFSIWARLLYRTTEGNVDAWLLKDLLESSHGKPSTASSQKRRLTTGKGVEPYGSLQTDRFELKDTL